MAAAFSNGELTEDAELSNPSPKIWLITIPRTKDTARILAAVARSSEKAKMLTNHRTIAFMAVERKARKEMERKEEKGPESLGSRQATACPRPIPPHKEVARVRNSSQESLFRK